MDEQKIMHIAFGVDKNFIRGVGVNIISIFENNREMLFEFHVFTLSIYDIDKDRFEKLEEKYNIKINIIIIDSDLMSQFYDFPKNSSLSIATFARLLIPGALKSITDRVLYLDADIVCNGKLKELFNIDLLGYIAAVVSDNDEICTTQSETLNLEKGKYFNAGFLYINIEEWEKYNVWNLIVKEIVENGSKFKFNDQDALNVVIGEKVRYISKKYNYLYGLAPEINTNRTIPEDTVFIHYVGILKPWYKWCLNSNDSFFRKFHDVSPWQDEPLEAPNKPHQMRIYSRCLNQKGKKFDALITHIKYLKMKIIK